MAVEDKALRAEVHACLLTETVQMDFEQPQVSDLGAFVTALDRARPDVVLLDVSTVQDRLRDVVRGVRMAAPASMLVALNTSAATGPVLECFRAGVDEYLFPPLAEGLKKALERREAERRKSESGQSKGKTLAFLSAKGGCGATTLACHTALELSRLNHNVLLADLDVNAGMVSFLMKSKSPYSIADALNNVHRLDASYWKALVSNGIPHLEVISAPTAVAVRQELKLEEIRHVLGFARTQYQWTVADAGGGMNYSSMTVLESADEAFLVTTPEIPALHQTKQILQKLLDGGYRPERLHLVLNRVPKRLGIRPEEFQEMLGIPLYAVFPDSYTELHEAYSKGQLLPSKSDLSQQIGRFARKLAGQDEQQPRRKVSFFR